MKHLTLASIDTVCWIARLGSFTAAAARLNTTQPAVSGRVRELEARLGVKLFKRVGRRAELSLEGREFVRQVEPLLHQLEDVSVGIGEAAGTGRLRIGATMTSMTWFPRMIDGLQQKMPALTYEIEVDRPKRLFDLLAARKLDVAIVSGPVDTLQFTSVDLGFDRMLWVMSPRRTPDRQRLPVDQLLRESLIWSVPRSSFYSSSAMRQIVKCGVPRGRISEISSLAAAVEMVRRGAGISLLPESVISDELRNGTLIQLPEPLGDGGTVQFSIVHHRDDDEHYLICAVVDAAVRSSTFRKNGVRKRKR